MDANKLKKISWNDFSRYPYQGRDIYLHLISNYSDIHKFVKVEKFNAVMFNPGKVAGKLGMRKDCMFMWQYANIVETLCDK